MSNGNRKHLLTIPFEGNLRETDAARGVYIGGDVLWFPKSQIEDFEEKDGKVSFWCPEWLIEQKGVEAFVDTSYEPSLF